jgi:hypothetical protein
MKTTKTKRTKKAKGEIELLAASLEPRRLKKPEAAEVKEE